ncbi:hypothetical protein COTS27_00674 [Spirochaetota bacterium]|nr:hypothetical protein COTS27_00674 [Spirochaetota bacterium]
MIKTAIKDEASTGLAILQQANTRKSSSREAGLLGSFSEHLIKNLSQNLTRSAANKAHITTSASSMSSTSLKAIRESYDPNSNIISERRATAKASADRKDRLDDHYKADKNRSEIKRITDKKASSSKINDEKSSHIEFEANIEHLKAIKEHLADELAELEAYIASPSNAQLDENDIHSRLVNSKAILEELFARLEAILGAAFSNPLPTSSPTVTQAVGSDVANVLSYENTTSLSNHSQHGIFAGAGISSDAQAHLRETSTTPWLDIGKNIADLKAIEQNLIKWLETLTSHLDSGTKPPERTDLLGTHLKGFLGLLNHHLAETLGTLSQWQYQSSLAGERSEIRIEDFLKQLEQNMTLKRESDALRYQKELATVTQPNSLHPNYGKEHFTTSPYIYTTASHLKQSTVPYQSFYGNQSYYGGEQGTGQGFQNFTAGQLRPQGEFIANGTLNGSLNGNLKAPLYPHISKSSSSGKSLLAETPFGGGAHGGTGHEVKSIREFTPFTARLNPSVLLDKLVGGIKSAARNGSEIFTLTLKPDNLGQVSVLMKKTSHQFKVRLIVENSTVKDIIENKLADIKGQLAGENIDLKELTVEIEYRGNNGHYDNENTKADAKPDYLQKLNKNNAATDDSTDWKADRRIEAISMLADGTSYVSLVI